MATYNGQISDRAAAQMREVLGRNGWRIEASQIVDKDGILRNSYDMFPPETLDRPTRWAVFKAFIRLCITRQPKV